jgi:HD-like signal output (HDOD) protein
MVVSNMNETANHLEHIASRAMTLYTRPTVALELVRLAEEERADANAIKACVARDPGLTCKILRVVNSSMYGLNRPVADLNQAIGLLGIKSLKLLVLGFSLPDALFAELAGRQLQWYWTNALTRAVAARLLAEQIWHQSGDEAFTAGILQDIGILVLLHELGEPYARFLTGVIEEKCHLAALEQEILGFDHHQLSAALLKRWQLPQRLIDAIALPKRSARLARLTSPEADLPQILHLAELLVQLVGQRRLGVLADLLEAGKQYRGMTKNKLRVLVEGLQPQVDQLAEVLSLELAEKRDYVQMLVNAHQRMAAISEQVPALLPDDDRAYAHLLAHTRELSGAMQNFLAGSKAHLLETTFKHRDAHAPHEATRTRRSATMVRNCSEAEADSELAASLVAAAARCRDRRQELSLVLVEPHVFDVHSDPEAEAAIHQARFALEHACVALNQTHGTLLALSRERTAAILPNCERRTAIALAQSTIAELARIEPPGFDAESRVATTLSIGIATASVVPKNFDPLPMIESAARCLSAARACGISTVKSIEV